MKFRKIPAHIYPVLMLGVVSQIGQVLLLRELLMVFHGNELAIGIILSAWLAWTGLGSRIGIHLVDRMGQAVYWLKISVLGVLFLLPATILIIRSLRGFFDVLPGAWLTLPEMFLSCFMLMGPVCLLLGSQFVLLSRIWRERENLADTTGAGKTYMSEAAGNMVGGILFTFVLVHLLNPFQSAVLAAGVMLAAVFLILPGQVVRSRVSFIPLFILFIFLLGAPLFYFLDKVDGFAHSLKWSFTAPDHELVETRQSKHGSIAVLKLEDQYSFFQSGHLVFSTAGPETLVPGLEGQEAVSFAHLAMVQHKNPEKILLIGGGLRGTLAEIARHPVQSIDYIEVDEKLIQTAAPYVFPETLEVLEDPRVNLIHTDARLFVKQADQTYDLIIVDTPDPTTSALNRFYTREFFMETRKLLDRGGVLVTGTSSTPDLRGTAISNRNAAVYHTLNDVFSLVLVAGDRFMFYFASDDQDQVSVDPFILRERYNERGVHAQGFSPVHFQILLEETRLLRINWIVRRHGRDSLAHIHGPPSPPITPVPLSEQLMSETKLNPVEKSMFINSDFKPIVYYYTLMYWDHLTRTGERDLLKSLLHIRAWWILPFMAAPVIAAAGLRLLGNRGSLMDTSFGITGTAFSTGMSTMILQIALLFSFQNIYGFIYETVGLIVALFMLGLALGAYCTHRFIPNKSSLNTLALFQVLMAALTAVIGLVLPLTASLQSPVLIFGLFSILTFTAGLINGINYPLAAACFMAVSRRAEKSAGRVYGAELLGACLGAALASVLVVPILGIIACCLLAAAANVTAFFILLVSRRSYA